VLLDEAQRMTDSPLAAVLLEHYKFPVDFMVLDAGGAFIAKLNANDDLLQAPKICAAPAAKGDETFEPMVQRFLAFLAGASR
jgi:hypothetical protein